MSWDRPTSPQEELAKKRAEAKAAVFKSWMKKLEDDQGNQIRDPLDDNEKIQMGRDVEIADAKAILDYVTSRFLMTLMPAAAGLQTVVSLGAPTGPPAAPIPLQPGTLVVLSFKPPT